MRHLQEVNQLWQKQEHQRSAKSFSIRTSGCLRWKYCSGGSQKAEGSRYSILLIHNGGIFLVSVSDNFDQSQFCLDFQISKRETCLLTLTSHWSSQVSQDLGRTSNPTPYEKIMWLDFPNSAPNKEQKISLRQWNNTDQQEQLKRTFWSRKSKSLIW